MYEAKYSKYITHSVARFAQDDEIKAVCEPVRKGCETDACGAILHACNDTLYVDNSDAHYYIQGGTGSKKTRTEVVNIIRTIFRSSQKEAVVINDPKSEIYAKTAADAKKNGYDIYVLNFRDASKSHGWNPMMLARLFERAGDSAAAEQAISDFKQTMIGPLLENTVDRYWADLAGQVIAYSTALLEDTVPDEALHVANLQQMTNEQNEGLLREIMQTMDPHCNAYISARGIFDLKAEKTSSCIYSTTKQCLIPYCESKSLRELLCSNDIDFESLVRGKTVIYIIYPDEKTALGFLVNLFFTQCYQYLISRSATMPQHRLKKRVNFIYDEFSNLPALENFDNRISEARGHNIRFFLISQSFSQLKIKYQENAQTILANCDWIIFPSKDILFYEQLLEPLCGRIFDYYERETPLISAFQMQHLRKSKTGAEVLVIKTGQYPFVTIIPDYEYTDIFEHYPDAALEVIEQTCNPIYLTFMDWVNGIGTCFNHPFPKEKRTVDLRYQSAKPGADSDKKNAKNHQTKDQDMQNLEKELKRKFDEIFETVENEEDA